ncbi:hypothetical protein MJG53_020455 [Ovis ammon polii x Ovis aries]|uniref:Protein phosphatase 1 regulatory subunit 1C n=2 Tax=Ovis TaxID=9935 RepID=A0AAD4UF68_OVIAM|nr:hypothetical protein MG293_004302 [Ovis ammon polii]KAI4575253.1 hypothetical protein MJT46_019488 [Ovis ammon polii x Ovis aries]KAI4589431.1 hypothetical protein MJG53_020455 [Ovis ammon polii x Ovis aries]
MEPNSPKKIQFAVPLFQSQIAPEAAEQIRKRRPTPASLVILNEHNPPGKDAWYLMYQSNGIEFSQSARNKLSIIFIISGVKHMKGQNESAFPEEEEGVNERVQQWDH